MCPYYLDGDLTELGRARSVIPVATAAYRYAVAVATVQFSRAAERALGRPGRHEGRPAGTGLSKLNSMHRPRSRRDAARRTRRHGRPHMRDGARAGQVRSTF